MYDRESRCVHLFTRGDRRKKLKASIVSIDNAEELREEIGEILFEKLLEDIDVLDSLVSPPDMDRIQVLYLGVKDERALTNIFSYQIHKTIK